MPTAGRVRIFVAMINPSDNTDGPTANAAPTELQQLEAALQSKAISPALFATLAARLHLGDTPPVVAPSISTGPENTDHTELPSLLSLFESPPVPPVPPPAPLPLPAPVAAPPDAAAPQPQPPITSPSPPAWVAPPVVAQPIIRPVAPPVAPPPVYVPTSEVKPAAPPRRNALTTLLASLGGVGLLGVGLYLYVDQNHPDKNLTGPQPASTEEAAPARIPEPEAAIVAAPETVRVAAPTVATTDSSAIADAPTETAPAEASATTPDTEEATDAPAPESSPAAATNTTIPAPVPAAPEPDDDDATQKIRTVLAGYYADLFAPPLNAENYFAPQVERLYIQQHLTPAQINATITQTFFPDNKKAVYQVEPGTLRVSAPAQDGSRMATYSEACRLFRVSKGRYQRLRTQVRVKFDADYRITFLRQERMLENVFE